jgi:N-acetylglucosamine kinase-like BadF-type ATPase
MVTVLGIDAGQSGSRLRLLRRGRTRLSWTGPGIPPGVTPVQAMTGLLLDDVSRRLRDSGQDAPAVVGAGLTGFHGGASGAQEVLDLWHDTLGVRRLSLTDDAVTSYLGALGEAPGAVVAAGTGVTVLATGGPAPIRVNGWGPTVGDEGGGYWIGQRGLRSAFRWLDGRGGSELLAAQAQARFGPLPQLPGRLAAAEDRVALVASFAPEVASAAHAGDEHAARIWVSAGHELAAAVLTALRETRPAGPATTEPRLVSWAGSLFEAGELLLSPFREAVRTARAGVQVVAPRSDSLQGALELTSSEVPLVRALVDTAEIR